MTGRNLYEIRAKRFRNPFSSNDESISNPDVSDINISVETAKRRLVSTENERDKYGNTLSSKVESLDYEIFENYLFLEEEQKRGYKWVFRKNLSRWFVFLLIGILTALTASFVHISIKELSSLKFSILNKSFKQNHAKHKLYISYILWTLLNLLPVLIGSILVTLFEPIAGGSGIPQVKCYLNGVNVPKVVRIKTLFVKVIGVICSVVGGLACGKEGPMIHTGAIIAAGVSQGKCTTFNKDFKVFKYFREDHEKRDFVSGGAAAGVSSAFGAPVGGVLFSLEEGASFWNQSLTWMTFFASAMSSFTLNTILSAYYHVPGKLSYPGLLNLGKSETSSYELYELPMYALMGGFGGLVGALWIKINYKMAVFRNSMIKTSHMKIIEACFVAVLSATVSFAMILTVNECETIDRNSTSKSIQLNCPDGQMNSMSVLWFETPENSVKSLFHSPKGLHNTSSLLIFVIAYFFLSCITFGLHMSSGLFIPTLLIGAAWGRLVPIGLEKMIGSKTPLNCGKFALIGGAAQLGGVVRMTLSLTVILMEATGDISLALPLIVTLIAAKWTGDFFNEGIYDMYIRLSGIPMLPWKAPPLVHNIYASEVMAHPVETLKVTENVGHIFDLLKKTTFNGFPVVDSLSDREDEDSHHKIRGTILRSQLIVLLKHKLFNEMTEHWSNCDGLNIFREEYPRYPSINEICLSDEEKLCTIDLRPFMNPSPYTMIHSASLPRIFQLFRALGLRHLPVINDNNEVVGMITRKDLARYRVGTHNDNTVLEELLVFR